MADYHPLIARAVAGLDKNTGENRRALYERARSALVAQLRGLLPALEESEITRERLALEEAIRKVEADAARQARESARLNLLNRPERSPTPPPPWPLSRPSGYQQYYDNTLAEMAERLERALRAPALRRSIKTEAEAKENQIRIVRERLSQVASPAPELSSEGLLHAGPNPVYDRPDAGADLPTLPIRQRAIVKSIWGGLPKNAPRHLKIALKSYDDELNARGVQPILGLLRDMAGIIEAEAAAPDASDWLPPGLLSAFDSFSRNQHDFESHFPLDPEREEVYAKTEVDEWGAVGDALLNPYKRVAEASHSAHKAGLTTADFMLVVDKLTELASVLSTQPPPGPSAVKPGSAEKTVVSESNLKDSIAVSDKDRIAPREAAAPSTRKRVLLSSFGFFERTQNILASSAQLASPPEGNALLTALRQALGALSKLLGF